MLYTLPPGCSRISASKSSTTRSVVPLTTIKHQRSTLSPQPSALLIAMLYTLPPGCSRISANNLQQFRSHQLRVRTIRRLRDYPSGLDLEIPAST
jgi:hypothetical protein